MPHLPGSEGVNDFVEALAFNANLNDGTPARIRPITPGDKRRLAEGWEGLSSRYRYLRFMQAKTTLSDSNLVYLTEIDYKDHFAWAAEALDVPDPPGIGIARYVRDLSEPNVAEAALAVVDYRQRQGLGRILLQALIDAARENGIEHFRAYVSASNQQVIKSLTEIGATRSQAEAGTVTLELPLPTRPLRNSAMYEALRAAAALQERTSGHTGPTTEIAPSAKLAER